MSGLTQTKHLLGAVLIAAMLAVCGTSGISPEKPTNFAVQAAVKWNNNYGYNAAAGGWRVEHHPRYLADVTGDGRNDVVGFGNAGVYVARSTGSSF